MNSSTNHQRRSTEKIELGWVVTRDLIGTGLYRMQQSGNVLVYPDGSLSLSETTARHALGSVENHVPFRLLDDDDEVYYQGVMRRSWAHGPEHLAFSPLTWAMEEAGATTMELYEGNRWVQL